MTGKPLADRAMAAAATFRKELPSNENYAMVYDLPLNGILKLGEKTDNCLNTRRLKTAAYLIDQQLRIDVENPMPHAQLGRYYFMRAVGSEGNQKRVLLDKALGSLNDASELAKQSIAGKVLPNFHHKLSEGFGLAMTHRAHLKYETGDMAGAVADLQDSMKYDLPDEIRRSSSELLDFMKQEAAEAARYSNRKSGAARRGKPNRKNPSQGTNRG